MAINAIIIIFIVINYYLFKFSKFNEDDKYIEYFQLIIYIY